jgi:hypothetical protein
MSRTPIAFIAYGWKSKAKHSSPSVPYVIERLRRMLTSDEQRGSRAKAWPPPVTIASATRSRNAALDPRAADAREPAPPHRRSMGSSAVRSSTDDQRESTVGPLCPRKRANG